MHAHPSLNADMSQPALVRAGEGGWVPSPEPGVHRLMLERDGDEVARATTIVAYEAGSRFAGHVHELGEEFFVLDGVFSDENGHYGPGTYVRNPPGSCHSPYSESGCTIFVKLRQMRPGSASRVIVTPGLRAWTQLASGVRQAPLHADGHEAVCLVHLDAGATFPGHDAAFVEEVLVVDGVVRAEDFVAGDLTPWTWMRRPAGRPSPIRAGTNALLWVKVVLAPPPSTGA